MPALALLPRMAAPLVVGSSPSANSSASGNASQTTSPPSSHLAVILPVILVVALLLMSVLAWWLARSETTYARRIVPGSCKSRFLGRVAPWEGPPSFAPRDAGLTRPLPSFPSLGRAARLGRGRRPCARVRAGTEAARVRARCRGGCRGCEAASTGSGARRDLAAGDRARC